MKKPLSFTAGQVAELVQRALLDVAKSLQAHGIQINLAEPPTTNFQSQDDSMSNDYCECGAQKIEGRYGPYCFPCHVRKKKSEGKWVD